MANGSAGPFKYDTPQVSKMLDGGTPTAHRALRRWARLGRVEGIQQREKNAKYRWSVAGVLEAWDLWAQVEGLDPEADMPEAIKKLKEAVSGVEVAVASPVAGTAPQGETLTVTVTVPAGISVRVVTVAA